MVGTSGNDTFSGILQSGSSGDLGTFSSSDSISGGAGIADTLAIRLTAMTAAITAAPVLTSVENVYVSNVDASTLTATINFASSTGVVNAGLQNSSSTTSKVNMVGLAATVTAVLDNAKGELDVSLAGTRAASATGTNAVAITLANGSGTAAAPAKLIYQTAGGATEATLNVLNIAAAGVASTVDITAGANVNKIVVTGATTANATTGFGLNLVDSANAFSNVRTVDASAMTGGGLNISLNDSNIKTIIGSAGNDRVVLIGGIANLNTNDTITLAAQDILAFGTDTSETAGYTSAKITAINASKAGILEFTAANFTTINETDFAATNYVFSGGEAAGVQSTLALTVGTATVSTIKTTLNAVLAAGAIGAAGANGTAGTAGTTALSFTGAVVGSTANAKLVGGVTIEADGGAGGAGGAGAAGNNAGGTGAAGANAANAITFGSNVNKLVLDSSGLTANTIQGGFGGAGGAGGAGTGTGGNGSGGNGGNGAEAISNGTTVQNLSVTGSQDLTIKGGTGGAAGTGGTGVAGTDKVAGFTNSINVDATAFLGKLTVNLSTGNDVLSFGVNGGTVRGMSGLDTINFNAVGVDKLNLIGTGTTGSANLDSVGSGSSLITLNGFVSGLDKILVSTVPTAVKSGGLFTTSGTGVIQTDVAAALTAGGGFGAANNAAVVTVTGGTDAGTYLVIDSNSSNTYTANTDSIVKIVGGVTFVATDFALS